MVNEIKLDSLNPVMDIGKQRKDKKVAGTEAVAHEDMKVTNKLGNMVNQLLADNNQMSASQKIADLKDKINNNQYRVDLDKLAAKLIHSIIGSK